MMMQKACRAALARPRGLHRLAALRLPRTWEKKRTTLTWPRAYVASQSSDHRTPQLPIKELEYSDEKKSRHAAYYNSGKPTKGWRSLLPSKGSKRLGSAPR
jgi:hypothetical protein